MLKWLNKNLRPSQKIAAVSRAVVNDFRKRWTFRIKADIEIDIVPKDSDGDGVPDIDELCAKD